MSQRRTGMDTDGMTPISKLLKDFQATDQQGHSLTSKRTEDLTCSCGKTFTATIFTVSGREMKYEKVCPECSTKLRQAERLKDLEKELVKREQNRRDAWFDVSGLQENVKFGCADFESFDRKLQPKAYDAVINFDWNGDKSLVLASPNVFGVGKTHLVTALVNKVIKDTPAARIQDNVIHEHYTPPVLFVQENNLLRRIRSTYNQGASETEQAVYAHITRTQLVIVDDVGKLQPKDSSFLQGVWFTLLDDRYSTGSPMVLTTNLSPDQLETHIGGACADRLREMCGKKGFIVMAGTSYRRR